MTDRKAFLISGGATLAVAVLLGSALWSRGPAAEAAPQTVPLAAVADWDQTMALQGEQEWESRYEDENEDEDEEHERHRYRDDDRAEEHESNRPRGRESGDDGRDEH